MSSLGIDVEELKLEREDRVVQADIPKVPRGDVVVRRAHDRLDRAAIQQGEPGEAGAQEFVCNRGTVHRGSFVRNFRIKSMDKRVPQRRRGFPSSWGTASDDSAIR